MALRQIHPRSSSAVVSAQRWVWAVPVAGALLWRPRRLCCCWAQFGAARTVAEGTRCSNARGRCERCWVAGSQLAQGPPRP